MEEKFLAKNYRSCLNYVKESKKFILVIIAVFFGFALAGFFIPAPENLKEWIMNVIKEIFERTKGMNAEELTGFIFLNNARSSFLGMIFGVLLGIFPLYSSALNGWLVGFVSSASVREFGILSLWRLLPHGIFELTGVFISLGMGLRLGTLIFKKPKKEKDVWKYKVEILKKNLILSVKTFLLIVVPLLIIAAVIEGILISVLRA